MLKRIWFFVVMVGIILFGSCDDLKKHPIINTSAEITSIEQQSDTSVLVDIHVLRKSTAWSCYFKLLVDTTSYITSLPSSKRWHLISNNCNLEKKYELVVGGLKKNVKYYYRLFSYGTFDLGGPNQDSSDFTGKEWEYTTQ